MFLFIFVCYSAYLWLFSSLTMPCSPTCFFSPVVWWEVWSSALSHGPHSSIQLSDSHSSHCLSFQRYAYQSRSRLFEQRLSFPPKMESYLRTCGLYLFLCPHHRAECLVCKKCSDFLWPRDLKQHPGWGGGTVKAGNSTADGLAWRARGTHRSICYRNPICNNSTS